MDNDHSVPTAGRVVIVEDELLVAMDMEDFLSDHSWDVVATVPTAAKALAALDAHDPDIVILDLNLTGESTLPVVRELKKRNTAFIVVSGYGDLRSSDPLLSDVTILSKPWNPDLLLKELRRHMPTAHKQA